MSGGYEIEELGRIEDAIDALVSPSSEDVFQATRPFDERAIASVAATRAGAGGGGSSPILAATVTLTNAQIKALPTAPFALVPATATLNYSGVPATLPVVVCAVAFLDSRAGGYTNLDAGTTVSLAWGSDQSINVARASTAGGTDALIQTVFTATTIRWLSFPITDRDAGSNINDGLQDNALVLAMNNVGLGALTGGDAANTMQVSFFYSPISL